METAPAKNSQIRFRRFLYDVNSFLQFKNFIPLYGINI